MPLPDYVQVKGYEGIAFGVEGEHDGQIVCHMVGDDREFRFDPDECTELAPADFCGECGQIGCCHGRPV